MALDPRSRLGRVVQTVAATRAFARVAPAVVPRLDRLVSHLSGGRMLLSSGMVPMIVLVTTGARSGHQRESPLATVVDGDTFLVVGSNFARERHPAWSYNLLAHPEALVVHEGRRIPVVARLLDAGEKAAVWPRLTAIWPTYDVYEARTERAIRVFELRPAAQQAE